MNPTGYTRYIMMPRVIWYLSTSPNIKLFIYFTVVWFIGCRYDISCEDYLNPKSCVWGTENMTCDWKTEHIPIFGNRKESNDKEPQFSNNRSHRRSYNHDNPSPLLHVPCGTRFRMIHFISHPSIKPLLHDILGWQRNNYFHYARSFYRSWYHKSQE